MTTKKVTLYINPAVHKLLKIKAAVADVSMSDVTNDVLEAYFESSDKKLVGKLKKAQAEADAGHGVDFEKVFGKL